MWVELFGLPGVGKTTQIQKNMPMITDRFSVMRSDQRSMGQKVYGKLLYHAVYRRWVGDDGLAKKLSYRHSFRLRHFPSKDVFFYDSGLLQVILEYYSIRRT